MDESREEEGTPNRNGLTLRRWFYAAGYGETVPIDLAATLIGAWQRGDDPAEYRLTKKP